jgi:hypothetical protein
LIGLWERLGALRARERANAICSLAGIHPGACTPGQHDSRVAGVFCRLFGAEFDAVATCPACAQVIDVRVSAAAVAALGHADAGPVSIEHEGRVFTFRIPRMDDLRRAAGSPEATLAAIVAGCLVEVHGAAPDPAPGGVPSLPDPLPDHVVRSLDEAFERADPAAQPIQIDCPACAAAFACGINWPDAVWTTLERHVASLTIEVALVARAFGWAERDILGMSAVRRSRYLDLATAGRDSDRNA